MKVLSFIFGLLTITLMIGGIVTLPLFTPFLSILNVDCISNNQECPPDLQESLQYTLLNKSFFITDFDKEINIPTISVVSFSKKIPGTVILEVEEKSLGQNSFSEETNLSKEQIEKEVMKHFENQFSNTDQIQVIDNQNTVVINLEDIQILTRISNLKTDLQKASLILEHLDLDTIDLDITEIDTRYKLPVLRTTKSTF